MTQKQKIALISINVSQRSSVAHFQNFIFVYLRHADKLKTGLPSRSPVFNTACSTQQELPNCPVDYLHVLGIPRIGSDSSGHTLLWQEQPG